MFLIVMNVDGRGQSRLLRVQYLLRQLEPRRQPTGNRDWR